MQWTFSPSTIFYRKLIYHAKTKVSWGVKLKSILNDIWNLSQIPSDKLVMKLNLIDLLLKDRPICLYLKYKQHSTKWRKILLLLLGMDKLTYSKFLVLSAWHSGMIASGLIVSFFLSFCLSFVLILFFFWGGIIIRRKCLELENKLKLSLLMVVILTTVGLVLRVWPIKKLFTLLTKQKGLLQSWPQKPDSTSSWLDWNGKDHPTEGIDSQEL